jgi:hypothetical protein
VENDYEIFTEEEALYCNGVVNFCIGHLWIPSYSTQESLVYWDADIYIVVCNLEHDILLPSL